MTDEKRGKVVSLSQAFRDVLPTEMHGGAFTTWTDEQWEAHDARVAESEAKRAAADVDTRVKSKWSRLADNGYPARAIEVARAASTDDALIQRVQNWDVTETSVLVISGSKGCGKTVAATWWASQRPHPPVFVRASTFAASSRYDRETRATWFAASAMVLDDLGAEYLDGKGSFLVDLDELVDVYYGDKRPLLITTNCTKQVFAGRYGERIVDRLRECASWYAANGDSRRARAR